MHGPPDENEEGATPAKRSALQSLDQNSSCAAATEYTPDESDGKDEVPWPWVSVGEVALGILDRLYEEHFAHAPERWKSRFYDAVSPTVAGDALVHLVRCRFESWRFDLDPDGRWAIVAPIIENKQLVDWAAFAVDDDEVRQNYRGLTCNFAVGLESATEEMRWRPSGRMVMHYSVWTWLRAECVGLLPVWWYSTTMHIKGDLNCDLVFDNTIDAFKAEKKIRKALCMPQVFVQARAA